MIKSYSLLRYSIWSCSIWDDGGGNSCIWSTWMSPILFASYGVCWVLELFL